MKLSYVKSKQATSTKKFNGKTYELKEAMRSRILAYNHAKFIRKWENKLVRVVKCDDRFFPYLIYVANK